jgi:hypothetical protein
MKKLLKNILIAFVSIGTIYMWVQAWTWLIAADWDTLDYTKWNDLVNKVLPIESDGTNVWIGTASPDMSLHINTNNYASIWLWDNTASGFHITKETDSSFNIWSWVFWAWVNRLRIESNGNIGIWKSPSTKLDVSWVISW